MLRLLGDRRLRERLVAGGMARVRGLGMERMVARTEGLCRSPIADRRSLVRRRGLRSVGAVESADDP